MLVVVAQRGSWEYPAFQAAALPAVFNAECGRRTVT